MSNQKKKRIVAVIFLISGLICLIAYAFYDPSIASHQLEGVSKDIALQSKNLGFEEYIPSNLYWGIVSIKKEIFISQPSVTNKTLRNEDKLELILQRNGTSQFQKCDIEGPQDTIPGSSKCLDRDKIISQINRIFGEDNGYTDIQDNYRFMELFSNESSRWKIIKYDADTKKYILWDLQNSYQTSEDTIYYERIKVTQTKDSIVITEKFFIYSDEKVWKDIDKKELISDYEESKEEEYFNKGSTVTYTFNTDANQRYYFESSMVNHE